MFHTFLHCEKNIKLHIIEIGNKDLQQAVVFFLLDIEKFFSVIDELSLEFYRVILIYKVSILNHDFFEKDFLKGVEYLVERLEVEDIHCIFESNLEHIYKDCLYSSQFFNSVTVCQDFNKICMQAFFAARPAENKNSIDFIEKVGVQISNILSEGEPYLLKVAKKMKLTPRVLSKKIKNEGEEFKLLVKQKRHEKALLLLQDKDVSLSDIAYTLGYTEHSAFTRAFKGWTGCSPCQFRKYFK
ncbi:helix-turn-helix domain-containing protein [Acinetobacter courvalinii]|uniref:helix-turn-helix domain-containing protein n=1 Tax=Acinetobacter courvalinii TaxID=280147 RepID=UPI0021D1856A|nr:AraC family transcriptional regulator [Acinetobacter courvalinii]MCU4641314.1 AraC family transcriptional regulator [Acinetobacter courvalinii]